MSPTVPVRYPLTLPYRSSRPVLQRTQPPNPRNQSGRIQKPSARRPTQSLPAWSTDITITSLQNFASFSMTGQQDSNVNRILRPIRGFQPSTAAEQEGASTYASQNGSSTAAGLDDTEPDCGEELATFRNCGLHVRSQTPIPRVEPPPPQPFLRSDRPATQREEVTDISAWMNEKFSSRPQAMNQRAPRRPQRTTAERLQYALERAYRTSPLEQSRLIIARRRNAVESSEAEDAAMDAAAGEDV